MVCLLAPALIVSWLLASPQEGASIPGPKGEQRINEAARAALKAAPRRRKVGRIRGVRVKSSVRFTSAPNEPYDLAVSYAFPARCRFVLSGAHGRNERFRLGSTFFGRDVQTAGTAKPVPSYLVTEAVRADNQLDMALREATLLWPDGIPFEGRGTTFTAKVDDIGILMATVDEATGRPTRMRVLGANGKVGAELRDIVWSAAKDGGRSWPRSLTFAAGGEVVWKETITAVEDGWLFADAWFLPPDRLAAVLGKNVKEALRIRAQGSAWVSSVPLEPVDGQPPTLGEALRQAADGWDTFRRTLPQSFGKSAAPFALPTISITLGDDLSPLSIEYEARAEGAPSRSGEGDSTWSERPPRNVWIRLCEGVTEVTESALAELKGAAGGPAEAAVESAPPRLRFGLVEERIGNHTSLQAVDLRLVLDAAAPAEAAPPEDR